MSILDPEDATVINVRVAHNMVRVDPWKAVPAAGSTMGDLREYVQSIGDDPGKLSEPGLFDPSLVDYGDNEVGSWTQYWVPKVHEMACSPIVEDPQIHGCETPKPDPTTLCETRAKFRMQNQARFNK